MMRHLRGIYVIWYRDVKRYFMDRTRSLGSLGMPILFLVVFGFGMRSQGASVNGIPYPTYIFPGIVAMSMLFTSTFSAISIIWDREFGFLKEVLVSPVSRSSIVIGKALGGATQGFFQGLVMLATFFFLIHPHTPLQNFPALFFIMFSISFCLTSLGIAIAARMKSFEGFQVIMNFVVMPIFFFSGALYPVNQVPTWLKWITLWDPMTYGVDALRRVLLEIPGFPFLASFAVLGASATMSILIAVYQFRQTD